MLPAWYSEFGSGGKFKKKRGDGTCFKNECLPLARDSFLSHSTGTGCLLFSVFPQQHPWQTVRCPWIQARYAYFFLTVFFPPAVGLILRGAES
jgi:hypothetical protein